MRALVRVAVGFFAAVGFASLLLTWYFLSDGRWRTVEEQTTAAIRQMNDENERLRKDLRRERAGDQEHAQQNSEEAGE